MLPPLRKIGDEGSDVVLRVHTHVREDAIQLFGFLTDLERQLFERLIAVNGVGPKLAVAVLSGIEPREFVSAVNRGDLVRLTRVPGIGRKTAERMVLELKDRLQALYAPAEQPESTSGDDRLRADLVSALQNLGYHRPQAEKAIETTLAVASEFTFEQALKSALRELTR